jgi:hypothetical protein
MSEWDELKRYEVRVDRRRSRFTYPNRFYPCQCYEMAVRYFGSHLKTVPKMIPVVGSYIGNKSHG